MASRAAKKDTPAPAACSVDGCERNVRSVGLCLAHYKRNLKYGNPSAGGTMKGAPAAFIDRALSTETDDCIEWPFATQDGYGAINVGGSLMLASRLVCIKAHGQPPAANLEAAHSCGNRPCVNKRHLRWATWSENSADKVLHGTVLKGEQLPVARLSDSDIREIRARRRSGEPQASVARAYGVHSSHIRRITSGEIWSHVKDNPSSERTAA